VVVIDTDVLMLAYAFHRDPRQATNARFLSTVQAQRPATTIYSVMELLGNLSFNLSAERLAEWPLWLQVRYGLSVLYPRLTGATAETFFHRQFVDRPLLKMQQYRMPFLDSLILILSEETPDVEAFVTWNARHYQGKTILTVLTPTEYLEA
jgi:hypothetical protein